MTEDQFYRSLFPRLSWNAQEVLVPPGDDCAAVRGRAGELLLVAVDQLVGNRHYRADGPDADSPRAAGRKLLARNLSDIAAMGGTPEWAVVAIAAGPQRDATWLDAFMDGLLELANAVGVSIIGGDMARAPADDVASLTILGRVAETAVVRRSGARPTDHLYATGCFGASLATGHHLGFAPRCREGAWLAEQGFANAMIDVSDGLLLDAERLAAASDVAVQIDRDAIPLRSSDASVEQALTDGEDYELLFAVSADRAGDLTARWPFPDVPLTRLGRVCDVCGARVTDMDGRPFPHEQSGFDHFVDT